MGRSRNFQVECRDVPGGVLIVDGDAKARSYYSRSLARKRLRIETVDSVRAAREALAATDTTLVLITELELPDGSGLDLIRSVRDAVPRRRWLRTLIVTGFATLESAMEAVHLGASGYLRKPVAPHLLQDRLSEAMAEAAAARETWALMEPERAGDQLFGLADAARRFALELEQIGFGVAGRRGRAGCPPSLASGAVAGDAGDAGDAGTVSATGGLRMLRRLLELENIRAEVFPDVGVVEPTWVMLLELMLAALEQRDVTVSAVCVASSAAETTALRRVEAMIAQGIVERERDSADRRRSKLRLTLAGRERMRDLLSRLTRLVEWERAQSHAQGHQPLLA